MTTATSTDDGLQAGAILLLALGEDCAAGVMRHLAPAEVQRLGERMARVTTVADAQFDDVLAQFSTTVQTQRALVGDTGAYVSNVLRRALGDDKAGVLIERIVQEREPEGLGSLRWMEPRAVAALVRQEHPQVIATILVHLDRDHAGAVLGELEEALRHDVVLRIATLEGVQPDALQDLDEALARVLANGARGGGPARGGPKAAAELLNRLGNGLDATALEAVRAGDEELAARIEEQMFTFSDLLRLDNRGMQRLLRDVGGEQLVVALKGAEPALRDHVFANMSSRAAETLREDLDGKGPVRLSDVEAEHKAILKIARALADEGEIMLGSSGGADFV